MSETPAIVAASAAVILPTEFAQVDETGHSVNNKFFVHAHVADAGSGQGVLSDYLNEIYTGKPISVSIPALPKSPAFSRLQDASLVKDATVEIAEELRLGMEKVQANPGVVFGFRLRLDDDSHAFGIIKADIEADRRFYMDLTESSQWTIGEVEDLLPAPRAHYAKYVIAPEPRGTGLVGVHDTQSQKSTAAAYLLKAIGATMPRTEGTKAMVARAAEDAGYSPRQIEQVLSDLSEDTPTVELVEQQFPEIEPPARERLRGTDERPMPVVRAEESLITTISTKSPTFVLKVDASVTVAVERNVITVTLPANHDEIKYRYS